jgi:hypothetical protein
LLNRNNEQKIPKIGETKEIKLKSKMYTKQDKSERDRKTQARGGWGM